MTKQEFLDLCDRVFKKCGFVKHRKHYYLDMGSDLVGSIIFQGSAFGKGYYLEGSFSYKDKNEYLPYPTLTEIDLGQRIYVQGKEPIGGSCEYMTTLIKYELYAAEEIEESIEQALTSWIMPAIQYGQTYIWAHEDLYKDLLCEARVLGKIK